MNTINDGGPAFPAKVSVNRDSGELQPHQFGNDNFCTTGLSLRDYFAAKAMLGAITGESPWRGADYKPDNRLSNIENDARLAYMYADAMLRARGAQ